MDYSNTFIPFLREDCINEFGQEKGTEIYGNACGKLASMLANVDYRGSKIIKTHITKIILPTMAYYFSLLASGYSKDDALTITRKETQKSAKIQKKRNESIGRFPFAFQILKLFIRGMMKRMYPVQGWDTEWIKLDSNEIHMNFNRCLHLDVTAEHGCPELCPLFCETDTIIFAGYEPKIRFQRSGTLATSHACCDFHFLRGK